MKKRSMIVQVMLLLAVSVTALTAATYAWFTASEAPKTDAFAVQVEGSVPLELAFYRNYGDGNGYVSAPASQTAPFVNNELLIPGVPLLCRADITNMGTRNAAVSIILTGLSYRFQSSGSVTAADALSVMQRDLTVRYATVFSTPSPLNDYLPSDDEFAQSHFLNFLSAENVPVAATIVPAFTLTPLSTAHVYFYYLLSADFHGINGVFSLSAAGMAFTS